MVTRKKFELYGLDLKGYSKILETLDMNSLSKYDLNKKFKGKPVYKVKIINVKVRHK